ncbi:MAG: VOC family protein [Halobacteriovoraceae bacterium]|jgi:catechol 2,3-dioxygenase-like lactoylglutathione lyase family enzyme|nr:VOC family protein [Halobacteriovoraceae bacterium]MBT5093590.1 VOC family protein [Halobacteriovoraceae bacterium]
MSLLTIDGFNVMTIYASNLEESVAFYRDIIGFEKIRDMEPGVLMQSKAAELMVYLEGGREKRQAAGLQYTQTCFCLSVAGGVKPALEAVKGKNLEVVLEYGDMASEFAGFQITDPDGNIVEIAGRP